MPDRSRLRRGTAAALVVTCAVAAFGCGGAEDASAPPPEASAGRWSTWLAPPSRVAVPPPPRAGVRERERTRLRRTAETRTAAEERAARRWNEGSAVTPWMRLALEFQRTTLSAKDPPAAARAYALTSVAMYDAAVTAWHWKYRYRRAAPSDVDAAVDPGSEPSYPSEHAAIAAAASRVLAYAYPEQPAPRLEEMAERAARSRVLLGANYPSDVEAGLKLGRTVARRVLARAKRDGYDRKWTGARPRGRGYWEPPPGSVAVPVRPNAGDWKTWVLRSGSELRPPPPPRYGSRRFLAETREVLDVSRRLTPKQRRIAQIWAGGEGTSLPPGLWNEVAVAQVEQSRLSTPRAARIFALVNTAMADAAVAVWDAKYAYWSPRPVNAIHDLGLDRDWEPLLKTPVFPSYVSGHSGFSAAAAEVLAHLFPQLASRFRAKAKEAAMSRLYGGIHFRSDNDTGLGLGRKVGRLVVARARRDGAER